MPNKKRKPRLCPHCGGVLRALQGEGPKRYGEDPKRPWELEGVAEIMAGAARGETMRRIAEHMQALGFKLRRGKRWNPGTVWRVIRRQEFLAKKAETERIACAVLRLASTPTQLKPLNGIPEWDNTDLSKIEDFSISREGF